ncbi:MAG: M1 family aminopeptidase [Acidobacteriota bacterium]
MKTTNLFLSLLLTLGFLLTSIAQTPTPTPSPTPNVVGEVTVTASKANVDPGYQEIRKISDDANAFSGEYATVNNLVLKRDAGIFTLKSGEVYFLKEAQGKRTGAVFFGEGELSLIPPVESEKQMLNFFIESSEVKEQFTNLVLFFTDETFDEIKASPNVKMSVNGSQSGKARDEYREKESLLKNTFRFNMTSRILMDVYSSPRRGFFTSFINGKKHSKLLFQLDPLGLQDIYPEQVSLRNYDGNSGGVWLAFHLAEEYLQGTATSSADRRIFDLLKHDIDITIKGEKIFATDKVTMALKTVGQRVLPFELYPTLKVKRVSDKDGKEIDLIQETKSNDRDLAVILPKTYAVGEPFILNFEYEGGDVVEGKGVGNYILNPSARGSWYPANGSIRFGLDQSTFDINFRYPKQLTMIGVGELIEEKIEGDQKVSKWSTKGLEMKVAGFNYGDFKRKTYIDESTGYELEVIVNSEPPEEIKSLQNRVLEFESRRQSDRIPTNQETVRGGRASGLTIGAFSTSSMADDVMSQTQNSTRIYDAYFGKLPYRRIAITQQPNTFFGQAWATLIYMPYMAFVGETMRAQLFGIRGGTDGFWREVAAHEVAHQWWGHTVGWTSYRDQWMSEGFAQLSTSIYIQFVKKDIDKFNEFWEEQRELVVEPSRSTNGIKPYTVGPVTQGFRLSTPKTAGAYQRLVYPKGAYILHMIRMMMMDRKDGDAKFQAMMRDFIKTHYNKGATTEDFKAIVEKHITPKMDVDQNGKMDWYFDQWVYGKEVPAYKLEYSVKNEGGKYNLSGKITQSGVSDNFAMIVPLYLDFGSGWVSAGNVTIVGNKSFDLGNIPLAREPKKVAICALNDVLATKIENVKL